MAGTTKKTEAKAEAEATVAAPKAKRKTLTREERIAKAEADLVALREKVLDADRKQLDKVVEKITKVTAKRDEAITQLVGLEQEKSVLESRLSPPTVTA